MLRAFIYFCALMTTSPRQQLQPPITIRHGLPRALAAKPAKLYGSATPCRCAPVKRLLYRLRPTCFLYLCAQHRREELAMKYDDGQVIIQMKADRECRRLFRARCRQPRERADDS